MFITVIKLVGQCVCACVCVPSVSQMRFMIHVAAKSDSDWDLFYSFLVSGVRLSKLHLKPEKVSAISHQANKPLMILKSLRDSFADSRLPPFKAHRNQRGMEKKDMLGVFKRLKDVLYWFFYFLYFIQIMSTAKSVVQKTTPKVKYIYFQ